LAERLWSTLEMIGVSLSVDQKRVIEIEKDISLRDLALEMD